LLYSQSCDIFFFFGKNSVFLGTKAKKVVVLTYLIDKSAATTIDPGNVLRK